uniref:Uncharacterized protein n=1 Tax=Mola mola TaxID=94237 RepID=A0A3Q3WUG5_MOLML
MFAHVKNRKVHSECRKSKVAVFKYYNLNRHYVNKHEEKYKNLSDEERAKESKALLAKPQTQQGLFTELSKPRDAAVKTSYVLSHKIRVKTIMPLTVCSGTIFLFFFSFITDAFSRLVSEFQFSALELLLPQVVLGGGFLL